MKTILTRMLGLYLDILAILSPRIAGRKGFLLFCRPFRTPINEKQATFFNSAKKFSLKNNGISIQGYRWGEGEKKILFLHGWQSHSYRWKAYVEAIPTSEYTVYALDAPGHGLSEGNFLSVPVYSELIEQVIQNIGPVHSVVAHSLGCFSLLYTFYRLPELPVAKVILMAPPGEAQDFVTVFRQTLKISDRTLKLILDHFVSTYNVKPDYFSAAKFAASVNVNGLIIHDEDDQEAPYHYTLQLKKQWKKSHLHTTRGLGHNLKSTSIVKEVIEFIAERSHQPVDVGG